MEIRSKQGEYCCIGHDSGTILWHAETAQVIGLYVSHEKDHGVISSDGNPTVVIQHTELSKEERDKLTKLFKRQGKSYKFIPLI